MRTVRIAFRNIFRNTRRSMMTILAIGVSALSVILFGGFIFSIVYGLQTGLVKGTGHLHIYQKGYFDFGSANPAAYGIGRYEEVKGWVLADPQLKEIVEIVTPMLKISGIAGNFEAEASKTFFGMGVIPSDCEKMQKWNQYQLKGFPQRPLGLSDEDTEGGIIGVGMARMLQLCEALHVGDCRSKTLTETTAGRPGDSSPAGSSPAVEDFSDLAGLDETEAVAEKIDKRPKLDLLAATAKGAPNVVTFYVNKAESQGVKELDDSYVGMHISLAQRLLYGKGEKKVSGIVLQLKHTTDIPSARARLQEIFSSKGMDFEIKDFTELSPTYGQVISMFTSIFSFIAVIMGVIVLFTIVNTMSMSVMERVNEIGTIRALGVRQGGVLRQFLMEGCLLGVLGATIGCLAAMLASLAVNAGGLTWVPPNNVDAIPLSIQVFENPFLLPATWTGLVILAVVSSFVPAKKAGKMTIVDALRHI